MNNSIFNATTAAADTVHLSSTAIIVCVVVAFFIALVLFLGYVILPEWAENRRMQRWNTRLYDSESDE